MDLKRQTKFPTIRPLLDNFRDSLNPGVFFPGLLLVTALLVIAALIPQQLELFLDSLQQSLFQHLSPVYVLCVAVMLLCVPILAFSRYGDIRLGRDDEQAQFSLFAWASMLFSCGMGVGLLFFGVSEPLTHYIHPPVGESESTLAAQQALTTTFFHWGLHAWSIYAIVGLILAYFGFRHHLPLTLKGALYPLFSKKMHAPLGKAADIFALLATVLGIATSLGFGLYQLAGGIESVFGIVVDEVAKIGLLTLIALLAGLSAVSGIGRGVRLLSQTNCLMTAALMALILWLGPVEFTLKATLQSTGMYLSELLSRSFHVYAYRPNAQHWFGQWTVSYWGWWLAFSPFVGLFIAKISRGRTIREFLLGAILLPGGFTLLWMGIFGSNALYQVRELGNQALAQVAMLDPSGALFDFLGTFPMGTLLKIMALFMLVIYLITSIDSGALVADALSVKENVDTDNDSRAAARLFWTSTITLTTLLLMHCGGLKALQTLTLVCALPFALLICLALWGLFKQLRKDISENPGIGTEQTPVVIQNRPETGFSLLQKIKPTLAHLAHTLKEYGTHAHVFHKGQSVFLRIHVPEVTDFVYAVHRFKHENEHRLNSPLVKVNMTDRSHDFDIVRANPSEIWLDVLLQYRRYLMANNALSKHADRLTSPAQLKRFGLSAMQN